MTQDFSITLCSNECISRLASESYKHFYKLDDKFLTRPFRSELIISKSSIIASKTFIQGLKLLGVKDTQIEKSLSTFAYLRHMLKDELIDRPYSEYWIDALLLEKSDFPLGAFEKVLYPTDSITSVGYILRSIFTFAVRYCFTEYLQTYDFDPDIVLDDIEDIKKFLYSLHPNFASIPQDYYVFIYSLTEPEIFEAVRSSKDFLQWFAIEFFRTSKKYWLQIYARMLFSYTSTVNYYSSYFANWLGLYNAPLEVFAKQVKTFLQKLPVLKGKLFFPDGDEDSIILDNTVMNAFYDKILLSGPKVSVDTDSYSFHFFDYDTSIMSVGQPALKVPKSDLELEENLRSSNLQKAVNYYFTAIFRRPFKQIGTYLDTINFEVPDNPDVLAIK